MAYRRTEAERKKWREYARQWRAAHIDSERERQRKHYARMKAKGWYATPEQRAKAFILNSRKLRGAPCSDPFDVVVAWHKNIPSVCSCCGKDRKRLVLDHNHETGRIRGWICSLCNTDAGKFESADWQARMLAWCK